MNDKARKGNERREDDEIKKLFRAILTSGRVVKLIQPDIFIAQDARNLRWDNGLTLKIGAIDLIHFASAASPKIGCSEFLTTEFLNKHMLAKLKIEQTTNLKIIRPSSTAHLPAEYLQEKLSL